MHSNATVIKYAADFVMTAPTVITGLISIVPARSKVNVHDRKHVNTRLVKKASGRRDPGSVRFKVEFEKAQHAALEGKHKAYTEDFWQIDYSDGGKDKLGKCLITEIGPPEISEDNVLEAEYELTCIDGDDDFTVS